MTQMENQQHLEGLGVEVFGRMSAGISGQKLPLWAEFPFLSFDGYHAKSSRSLRYILPTTEKST